jgi:hypothetical protein
MNNEIKRKCKVIDMEGKILLTGLEPEPPLGVEDIFQEFGLAGVPHNVIEMINSRYFFTKKQLNDVKN